MSFLGFPTFINSLSCKNKVSKTTRNALGQNYVPERHTNTTFLLCWSNEPAPIYLNHPVFRPVLIAPPFDLFGRIPLCYVPHTCRQPIRTVHHSVSSLRYSLNRTDKSWHPFLSRPQGPQCSSGPVWKSTYPCPASYCLKLSTVFSHLFDVSVLAWDYRKHIAQTAFPLCICYIVLPLLLAEYRRCTYRQRLGIGLEFVQSVLFFNRFSTIICAICCIFIVHCGRSANRDALSAFRQEENLEGRKNDT